MARVSKRTSLKLPQFVQKIISKTTEVKNLVTQIQNLTTQKAELEANNQSTAQVQAQLTQKQNTLAKKVVRVETKVNSNASAVTAQKISSNLIFSAAANRLSYSDYIDIQGFNTGAIDVGSYKINNKSLTNFGSITEGNSPNYRYLTFNVINGNSTLFVVSPYSKNGILALHANQIANGESFLTKLIPYLRDDAWIVWDKIENTVFYNFNIRQSDSISYMPLKGWVRNNLFKTSIELIEVLNAASSGSSSGSGSGSGSGAVGSVGIPILEEIFNNSQQIIWDYAYDTVEEAGNYTLKKTSNNPIIADDIQNKIDFEYLSYLIIPKSVLSSNPNTYPNYQFIKRLNPPFLNSSTTRSVLRRGGAVNKYIITSAASAYIASAGIRRIYYIEQEDTESPNPSRVYAVSFDGLTTYSDIYARSPVKVADGSYPNFFEVYENGRVWIINYSNAFSSDILSTSTSDLDQIANGQLSRDGFQVYQSSVYKDKFYADNTAAPITITQEGKVRTANITDYEATIPQNIFSIDDIKKCVGISAFSNGRFYTLLNNGDLYFYGSQNTNFQFVLCDSSIRDITYNYEFGQVVGITTTYDLKRFSNTNYEGIAGTIHGDRKYKQIGKRYAIQYFA